MVNVFRQSYDGERLDSTIITRDEESTTLHSRENVSVVLCPSLSRTPLDTTLTKRQGLKKSKKK